MSGAAPALRGRPADGLADASPVVAPGGRASDGVARIAAGAPSRIVPGAFVAGAGADSVFERVARERREAHEPPEARGLRRDEVRMLVARRAPDGETSIAHARARDLADHLRAGDVLVVNTSATLPAALPARRADGTSLRLHLSTPAAGAEEVDLRATPAGPADRGEASDDRAPLAHRARWVVELRLDGERFRHGRAGEVLDLPGGATATLLAPYLANSNVTQRAPGATASRRGGAIAARPSGETRLWVATLDTGATSLRDLLHRHGAPIRYGHTRTEFPLRDYQTVFALDPGSAEMPSAGRPFTPELVTDLVARGIVIAPLTLHAGVSSLETGEEPYPERFSVPATSARLVNAARAGGGRVIAVGTTVVRALETVALPFGHVEPDAGWTRHVVTPRDGVRVVDGLLTGWHDPGASHLQLLEAIGGRALIEDSYAAALDSGYRWHEFGDVHLVLP